MAIVFSLILEYFIKKKMNFLLNIIENLGLKILTQLVARCWSKEWVKMISTPKKRIRINFFYHKYNAK